MTRDEAEELKRHFDVVGEGLRSEIRQVEEGVVLVSEKIDRTRAELGSEISEVRGMIYCQAPSSTIACDRSRRL
jgi:hypothetical protein